MLKKEKAYEKQTGIIGIRDYILTACGSESKGGGSPDSATTTIREKEKNRGVDNKSAGSDSTGTGKNTGKPK